ncbi:hypothetical protein [Thalassomonas sp. M1454]|uniref:hypothetical protein n=1 Tax=Thalassomonas sp. M1454 TaxID=2594477 RepID=UPI00119005B0|nr:hypothetical protein [Thalassomonas sp. M1454]TRX55161.1 hypothetical protein FNN08_11265 [Thalassomonas sp. M1454]
MLFFTLKYYFDANVFIFAIGLYSLFVYCCLNGPNSIYPDSKDGYFWLKIKMLLVVISFLSFASLSLWGIFGLGGAKGVWQIVLNIVFILGSGIATYEHLSKFIIHLKRA